MQLANMAAWQREPGAPLEIAPFAHPPLGAREVLVRNAVVALNPLDVHLHERAFLPWVKYPAILGEDVAGEIVAVGAAVSRLAVGDRVAGLAVGTSSNLPAQAAFQQHSVLLEHMASRIPDGLAFEDAAVLPLAIGTAACGLYQEANLHLQRPSLSPGVQGAAVLVWGASSAVGCNAVQLAVASGYDVVAVASASSADLVGALGARVVLDHRRPDIVERVIAALEGETLAGALHAIGEVADTVAAVARCEGRRRIASTWFPPEGTPDGVEISLIRGQSLKDDDLGAAIFGGFLPAALAASRYRPAPPPHVVGEGLEALQTLLRTRRDGAPNAKLVIRLR